MLAMRRGEISCRLFAGSFSCFAQLSNSLLYLITRVEQNPPRFATRIAFRISLTLLHRALAFSNTPRSRSRIFRDHRGFFLGFLKSLLTILELSENLPVKIEFVETSAALDKLLPKLLQGCLARPLAFLKQPQPFAHDLAGRLVAPGGNPGIDKLVEFRR